MTFEEFKKRATSSNPSATRNTRPGVFHHAFREKVELYSSILEKFGYDPLPFYLESRKHPSPPGAGQRFPFDPDLRRPAYRLFPCANKQIDWLREIAPDPRLQVHPETGRRPEHSDRRLGNGSKPQKQGRCENEGGIDGSRRPHVVHCAVPLVVSGEKGCRARLLGVQH